MPKIVKKLTNADLLAAKPRDKDYRLHDGDGLKLQIRPSGTKVWQYHYFLNGHWNIYTIGKLGDVSMVQARAKRDELKKLVDEGIAPNEHKKQTRIKRQYENRNSFEAIAREWHTKQNWAEKHKANVLSRLELDAFPIIGKQAINKISRQEVLHILQNIEQRGALDVAKRIGQYCAAIFDYALLKGLCESNPAMGLAKVVQTKGVQHRACLKEKELPDFLKKLEAYSGGKLVMLAMKLLMLTFVRPGELRGARWEEIDEKKAEWRIPASRMKMKRDHIVPLSKQSLAVIAEIKQISGNYEILFPGRKNIKNPYL